MVSPDAVLLSKASWLNELERRGTPADRRMAANDALSTAELPELRWEAMICGDGDRREERVERAAACGQVEGGRR